MKKEFLVFGIFVMLVFFAGCVTKKDISLEIYCEKDSECVPASCCHSKECVNVAYQPDCEGIDCTDIDLTGRAYQATDCRCIANVCVNKNNVAEYDQEILGQFEKNEMVSVIIRLKDNSNITIKGTTEERKAKLKQKEEWFKPIVDEFVSELPENKFELRSKLSNGFSGKITQDEYLRLFQNPMVESIGLNREVIAVG
ncbi:MAG: hypothetical protein U9O94_00885 [Nanoarchaeota archaeon]|nr:hypothetical protein [Nanoarchaeota archaeon]